MIEKIVVVENKSKVWVEVSQTEFKEEFKPRKVTVGMSRAFDTELTMAELDETAGRMANISESEVNRKIADYFKNGEPEKAAEKPKGEPKKEENGEEKAPTKKCSKCGQILKGAPSKFKEGTWFFFCGKCNRYEK